MKDIMLGIDIGGTNTAFGFVQKSGKVIKEFSILTKAKKPAEELVKRISKVLDNNENNYEIILVNDFSLDNSWGKILELRKKYDS